MAFWIGIIIAAVLGWQAVKIGFYETWATLFNILIAVYLSIFFSPAVAEIIPATTQTSYGAVFTMAFVAVVVFLILQGMSFVFFTSQFKVSFPKIFNIFLSGFLGFLAGFLAWSFVSLLIIAIPISQDPIMKTLGFTPSALETNITYLCRWCDSLNKFVSTDSSNYTTAQAIDKLLEKLEGPTVRKTTKEQTEPDEQASQNSSQNSP